MDERKQTPILCNQHFIEEYAYEPEMGDDDSTFFAGKCSVCGKDGIVFQVVILS